MLVATLRKFTTTVKLLLPNWSQSPSSWSHSFSADGKYAIQKGSLTWFCQMVPSCRFLVKGICFCIIVFFFCFNAEMLYCFTSIHRCSRQGFFHSLPFRIIWTADKRVAVVAVCWRDCFLPKCYIEIGSKCTPPGGRVCNVQDSYGVRILTLRFSSTTIRTHWEMFFFSTFCFFNWIDKENTIVGRMWFTWYTYVQEFHQLGYAGELRVHRPDNNERICLFKL